MKGVKNYCLAIIKYELHERYRFYWAVVSGTDAFVVAASSEANGTTTGFKIFKPKPDSFVTFSFGTVEVLLPWVGGSVLTAEIK